MEKCTCSLGEICHICKPMSTEALAYAQGAGVCGAQEAYYRRLLQLREEHNQQVEFCMEEDPDEG